MSVIEEISSLQHNQNILNHRLQHLSFLIPRITWTVTFIQTKVAQAAAELQVIASEYSHGRVACKEMATLFNIREIEDIDNQDTRLDSIVKTGPNIFRFNFFVRKKSPDTSVYKVAAFKYWDNLTGIPSLMEYRGYNYLIVNETANCLKAIEEPGQRAVLETCYEANYTDPRLSMWEKLIETRDIYKYNHTCQVKRTMLYNYIYCFPFNITTKMGVFRNPPHVYRLPLDVAFELPVMKYVPVIRRLNITGPFEFPAVDSIHIGQFPMNSEAIDEVKWFDKMQALLAQNEQLLSEKERSIRIEKQGGWFWFFIVLIIFLAFLIVGLIVYISHISQQGTFRQSRTNDMPLRLRTSLEGADNPQYAVGNDSSVNILVQSPGRTNLIKQAVKQSSQDDVEITNQL